jgi:hypothetical protein
MSRSIKLRQQIKQKTSLKMAIVAASASITGLVVLLIVVFNFSKNEQGHAAQSAMSFKTAETFQETSSILRGSSNQKVIKVIVETVGSGKSVKMASMKFSAKGTSLPIEQNIENARLWFTGNDPNFIPLQQVGLTISKLSDRPFEITTNQDLLTGKNYFWLTVDVKPDANYSSAAVDATCEDFRIGAISYQPLISDPLGKRFIEANVPYYSTGNYSVNKVNAWNSRRDGKGVAPKQLHASRNSYFIQAGHHMISSTGTSLQTLIVERGGDLRITAPLRLNNMSVAYGGVVENDMQETGLHCFNFFNMENGSSYIHNTKGDIPGATCTFEPKSNQTFFQLGNLNIQNPIEWGNVSLDLQCDGSTNIKGVFNHVLGNLEIRRTGTSSGFCAVEGSDKIDIDGSLILTGGEFKGEKSAIKDKLIINIGKNLVVNGGYFSDTDVLDNAGSTSISVAGDVMILAGTFNMTRGSESILKFEKGTSSKWIQKSETNVILGDILVAKNHELQVKSETMGDITAGHKLTVEPNAAIMCGNAVIYGEGEFHLSDQSIIGIGHPQGLASNGQKGNIRTAERYFSSGATYVYYTKSQPQETGVFSTTPNDKTIRCLVLNKEKIGLALTLSSDLVISDKIQIQKGDLIEGDYDLQLPTVSAKN